MKEGEKLFTAFARADVGDWEQVAQEELQGADPWKKLSHNENGVYLKPFYSPNDSKTTSFRLPAAANSFLGPRTWFNCPRVYVDTPEKANAAALRHLKQGADGIFFELNDTVDFSALLKDIDWRHCSLNFLANQTESSCARDLEAFLKKQYGSEKTVGAFFGSLDGPRPSHDSFCFGGHRVASSNFPIQELTSGIQAMDRQMNDRLNQKGSGVAFSLEIGTDLFLEIAKLRALRAIWDLFLTSKGIAAERPLFIHAHSISWKDDRLSPHENMLKGTTAAMASILGGCDALTVEPETHDATQNRVTRNISNILRDEAHFSLVADPLSGSYFIESLTQQLTVGVLKLLAP